MMTKLAIVLAIASVGYIVGIVGLWIGDRRPALENIKSEVLSSVVTPGSTLRLRTTAIRVKTCYTYIERVLIDSTNTRFDLTDNEYISPGPAGLRTDATILIEMPNKVALGPAMIKTTRQWECNPIHKLWPITNYQDDVHINITAR